MNADDFPMNDERISHCLGRILRYHTSSCGLATDEDGFVALPSLLANVEEFKDTSDADVRRVVKNSIGPRGARFEIRESEAGGNALIRALYKHPKVHHGDRRGRSGFSDRPRENAKRGFSQMPPAEEFDESPSPSSPQNNFTMSPPRAPLPGDDLGDGHFPIEEEFSALSPGKPRNNSGSASTETPREEVWERYNEPETQRVWFWNDATEEVFYADDASSGWEQWTSDDGKPWWYHEETGRFFFEEEEA